MEENGVKRLNRKPKLKIISIILILSVITGSMPLSGYAAPIFASTVLVNLRPAEAAADVGQQATFDLIVEGLGTDPHENQISGISFSSSDTDVADQISHAGPYVYTPAGGAEPTGLVYSVYATVKAAGAAAITATVTDTGDASLTRKGGGNLYGDGHAEEGGREFRRKHDGSHKGYGKEQASFQCEGDL